MRTQKGDIDDGARIRIPASISEEQALRVQHLSLEVFRVLGCAGLGRVDFLLAQTGEVYVNEINTMPGLTPNSMFPKMWEYSGIGAKTLVTKLIDLALERAFVRSLLKTSV